MRPQSNKTPPVTWFGGQVGWKLHRHGSHYSSDYLMRRYPRSSDLLIHCIILDYNEKKSCQSEDTVVEGITPTVYRIPARRRACWDNENCVGWRRWHGAVPGKPHTLPHRLTSLSSDGNSCGGTATDTRRRRSRFQTRLSSAATRHTYDRLKKR